MYVVFVALRVRLWPPSRPRSVCLDDARDPPGTDKPARQLCSWAFQPEGAWRGRGRKHPDPAEHRSTLDRRRSPPEGQRAPPQYEMPTCTPWSIVVANVGRI